MDEDKPLNDSLKILVKSSVIILIGIVFSKILSYIFRVIIARYMHSDVYGLFSLSLIIVECLVAISTMGLCVGVVRYISIYRAKNETKKIDYLIKISVNSVIFSSIFGGILLVIFSQFISENIFHNLNLKPFLIGFGIATPFIAIGSLYLSIIQAYEKMQWVSFIRNVLFNFVEIIAFISGLLIITFLLKSDKGLFPYLITFSYIIASSALLISSYLYYRLKLRVIAERNLVNNGMKKEIKKELFNYSWPLMLVGLVSFIFGWADSFIIGYFKDSVSVGIYNAAVPIASLLLISPQLFISLFLPIIVKEDTKKNFYAVKQTSQQVGKWIFVLNLPILILLLLFPENVIGILFGAEYIESAWPLRFLSIGLFLNSIFLVSENLLSMKGKSKIVLSNLIISSLLNITLNIILVPTPVILGFDNSLGIIGSSISTMISYAFWCILSLLTANRYSSIVPIRRKMMFIFLITLIPTLILVLIKNLTIINNFLFIIIGSFFIVFYFLIIMITGCMDRHDLMILRAIKNRTKLFRNKSIPEQ